MTANRQEVTTSRIVTFLLLTVVLGREGLANEPAQVQTIEPDSVVKPYMNRFSHGKLIPAGADYLFTAGQTGVDVDGRIGDGIEEQADLAMRNLFNIVIEAGMSASDVIKMTIYYTDAAYLPTIVAARNKHFGEDFSPASTAVGVSALARPEMLMEVEAVAAKVPAN